MPQGRGSCARKQRALRLPECGAVSYLGVVHGLGEADADGHCGASTAASVATAVGGVATATSSLLAALAPQCGSASASPGP